MHTPEQASAMGIPLAPKNNDMQRRAIWHDYSQPGTYMLTVVTLDRQRLLGRLVIEPRPLIDLTPLGQTILTGEVPKISAIYPNVQLWKVTIMPDHIHLLVEVATPFPPKKHLGSVVAGFKIGCNQAYRRIMGLAEGTMFDPQYNDRIIMKGMPIAKWKHYMDDNPRRLALKHLYPQFFTTKYDTQICGEECQTYDNLLLLDNPDKMAVIVHRRDTDTEYADNCRRWLECGDRGGVLVSAAISPREKSVIEQAMAHGYNVIRLCDNGFSPLYKPSGGSFDACAAGRLLQIALWEYHADRRAITRSQCLTLNALAERIAAM